MGRKTPLFERHLAAGARIVDFAGWDMPLHYGSQIEEHHRVRADAGVFDVSHMGVVDVEGPAARELLRRLIANDVDRIAACGQAQYGCMLNPDGGVIDDLITYRLAPERFRIIVNAGTREKDLEWIRSQTPATGVIVEERTSFAMLAVQGPRAIEKSAGALPTRVADRARQLQRFHAAECGDWFLARTGYTGEDGLEILLPAGEATAFWDRLIGAGVVPVGLGARDTLRLEAGMRLYGNDLDEEHDPLECGLAWTVAFDPGDRDFVGRAALERRRGNLRMRGVGLLLEDRGVLRSHQLVATDAGPGEITSGGFSPTLNRSIGLARVPAGAGERVTVDVRGKTLAARIVPLPFVRNGKPLISV